MSHKELKQRLLSLEFRVAELGPVFPHELLHSQAILQLQQGAQRPEQGEDEQMLQVLPAHVLPLLGVRWDKALEQVTHLAREITCKFVGHGQNSGSKLVVMDSRRSKRIYIFFFTKEGVHLFGSSLMSGDKAYVGRQHAVSNSMKVFSGLLWGLWGEEEGLYKSTEL